MMDGGQVQRKDQPLLQALRETREHLLHPVVLVLMLLTSFVMGVSGPFSTYEFLQTGPRIAYWTSIVVTTYGLGTFVSVVVGWHYAGRDAGGWKEVTVTGLANAVLATVFIFGLNRMVFAGMAHPMSDPFGLFSFVAPISISISWLYALVDAKANAHRADADGPARPRLLERVPPDQTGRLICLSVSDHYVRVTTTAGSCMLLMRLSDAIAETAPEAGLQVHRSHWVALEQIRSARRTGDTAVLVLSDGREVPVSRGKLPEVEGAGLLDAPQAPTAAPLRIVARG